MLQQYTAVKQEHPDVILMFRLGDFYEMFGEDAHIASKELEITLTSRDAGKSGRMPMCGVPYHSVDRYIARLISRGYRVAICDQIEDTRSAKGLVKREVTRVVTPGTVLEDSMLDPGCNNYLMAVVLRSEVFGLAAIDISTGEFLVTQIAGCQSEQRFLDEIARIAPAEVLVPEECDELSQRIQDSCKARLTRFSPGGFMTSRDVLLEHFETSSLRGFGCDDFTAGLDAAALVLRYLESAQPAALAHIRSLSTYSTSGFMVLDAPTRRNLELTQSLLEGPKKGSLLEVLDMTVTPMGGRLMRRWLEQPLLDVQKIRGRLDAVGALHEDLLIRSALRESLQKVYDLERLISRTVARTANARDLIALRDSVLALPEIADSLSISPNDLLHGLSSSMSGLDAVAGIIGDAIVEEPPVSVRDGGVIRAGFNPDLDTLRGASKDGKSWIASLEAEERQRTGIRSLKVGYNSVFGYYIEISKSNLALVPEDYIRKQTMVNGERFITPQLKEYEAAVLGAEDRAAELEHDLFCAVRDRVSEEAQGVLAAAGAVAQVDVLCSFAESAAVNRYCKPEVDDGPGLVIRNGRHPVVERVQTGEPFVPNDTLLDCEENQLLIITGPNMAGKSTYLRQVALITLMAQIGAFVPADSARIGVVDRIFTRVGAHDELHAGQSTFMVEMTETANILNNATERSLIILDEIGRGTSTFDGLSIAWAVAEHIRGIGAKTLFATHYHHLNDLAGTMPGIKNYRIAVKEDEERVIWLRKIVPGGTDRSYGIQVAKLAGLPKEVVERAKEVLWSLESNGTSRGQLGREVSVAARTERLQLTLFEAEPHHVIEKLEALDTSVMTPIEALTVLYDLQKSLRE